MRQAFVLMVLVGALTAAAAEIARRRHSCVSTYMLVATRAWAVELARTRSTVLFLTLEPVNARAVVPHVLARAPNRESTEGMRR